MAIFHLSVKTISRSAGRSATAAAAYRAGDKVIDARTGEVHDYRRKRGVESAETILPDGAPEWAGDRSALWSAAELAEKRKNSTVAREFEVALPDELSPDEQRQLVRDLAREIVERHGCVADVAIHGPGKGGDRRNRHAHILLSTRRLGADGFGEKTRELDDQQSGPQIVTQWRERWAMLQNRALERAGLDARVDHRSLKEQGVEREPTRHLGPSAVGYERRTGEKSRRRLDWEREVAERLARAKELGELEREQQAVESKIISLSTDLAAARAERDLQVKRDAEKQARTERIQKAAQRRHRTRDRMAIEGRWALRQIAREERAALEQSRPTPSQQVAERSTPNPPPPSRIRPGKTLREEDFTIPNQQVEEMPAVLLVPCDDENSIPNQQVEAVVPEPPDSWSALSVDDENSIPNQQEGAIAPEWPTPSRQVVDEPVGTPQQQVDEFFGEIDREATKIRVEAKARLPEVEKRYDDLEKGFHATYEWPRAPRHRVFGLVKDRDWRDPEVERQRLQEEMRALEIGRLRDLAHGHAADDEAERIVKDRDPARYRRMMDLHFELQRQKTQQAINRQRERKQRGQQRGRGGIGD